MDGQYRFGYYRLRFSPVDKGKNCQRKFTTRIILTRFTLVNCQKYSKSGFAGIKNGSGGCGNCQIRYLERIFLPTLIRLLFSPD